jgi:hypothetical protein
MDNMIGKEIVNYRIEQELGKGGMGLPLFGCGYVL